MSISRLLGCHDKMARDGTRTRALRSQVFRLARVTCNRMVRVPLRASLALILAQFLLSPWRPAFSPLRVHHLQARHKGPKVAAEGLDGAGVVAALRFAPCRHASNSVCAWTDRPGATMQRSLMKAPIGEPRSSSSSIASRAIPVAESAAGAEALPARDRPVQDAGQLAEQAVGQAVVFAAEERLRSGSAR